MIRGLSGLLGFLIILLLILPSCVRTLEMMPRTEVYLRIETSNECSSEFTIDIEHGTSELVDSVHNIHRVTFDGAKGGKTYFLGIRVRDHSAERINTVAYRCGTTVIKETNYDEISQLATGQAVDWEYYLVDLSER